MKTKHSGMALTWLLPTLLLAACGGGGGGSSTPAGSTPAGNTPTYTLSGQFQKGPFAIGSQISVNELDESLNPTGKVFNVQTSDDLGNFTVGSAIGTHLVEIVGSGFYMDELTGNLASSQVQIRAVADLGVDSTPTVNILTALQSLRLKKLITQGNAYAVANTQSQNEVLTAFGIDPTKVISLSTLYSMQINGSTDADSVLLAVSTILSRMATNAAATNSTTQPAELSNYINTIAAQLENTGTISTAAIITAKNLAATQIDLAAVRTNVETYYANRGVAVTAPKFEEWVDKDGSGFLPRRLVPTTGLSFTDQSGVEPNQTITSNVITVSGLGAGIVAPVTTDANTAIFRNNTAVSGTNTTAQDGDTIVLRVTSLGNSLTSTSTITVGTTSAKWLVTSKPLGGTARMLSGTGLILQNNGADNITIPAGSSSFNFNASLAIGNGYNVSVLTQPTNPAQVCTVANGTGTVGIVVSNIIVSCAGPVSGLTYTNVTGVDPQQAITSNTVTVSGLGVSIVATVTTDANSTIIKNGIDVTGTTTTAIDGDTIAMRVTSQGYGLTSTSTITVASSTATWSVTSKPLGGTARMLSGSGLVLQNNGGDNITIPAGSSSFNFNVSLAIGNGYNVSVLTQPTNPAQVCTVANGTGTVGAAPSNIIVSCAGPVSGFGFIDATGVAPQQAITSNTYTVSGLGTGITATVTADTTSTIIKNGTVVTGTTTTAIDGDIIALRITSKGYGLTNVSTVTVASSSATWLVTTQPLGGTVRMLSGTGLVLQNNSGDNITIPAGSTTFNFALPVANGASYNVAVMTQPSSPAQICSVANGTGTVGSTPSNVIVSCAGPVTGLGYTSVTGVNPGQAITSNAYTVSGLSAGIVASVTVDASTTIIKNGTPVVGTTTTAIDGDTIAMRVTSLGYGLTNTSTISIASSSATWLVTSIPLGGTIRVLIGTGLVLQNNGADNLAIPAGSTTFNFNATLANGAAYNVTVLTQPTNPAQVCTVANATGTVGSVVSNIIVSCAGPVSGFGFIDVTGVDPNQAITSNIYTVSGLGSGIVASVTADANTSIIKNGTAVSGTTTTAIDGDTIALRVTSLGYGLTSTSTITIASSSATWLVTTKALSGTISGLTSSGLVLQNNGGDNINIAANATSFIFPASVANGVGYSVSVLTQPTNPAQVCAVANGTGTVGSAISSVIVSCSGPVTGLSYSDVTGVDPMQTITSSAVTVSGLGTGISANVTVNANTTIIKNGTVIVGTTTSAIDGDTFALRVVSLGFGQTKTATISFVSYSSVNWNVTSKTKIVTFFQGSATSCSSSIQGGASADAKYIAIPFKTDQVDFISNVTVTSKFIAVGILTSGPTSGPLVPLLLEIQSDLNGVPSGTSIASVPATNGGFGLEAAPLLDRQGSSYTPNRMYIQGYLGSNGVALNQNTTYWLVAVYSSLTRPDMERCGQSEPTAFGQVKISTDGLAWTNAGVGYLPKLMLVE